MAAPAPRRRVSLVLMLLAVAILLPSCGGSSGGGGGGGTPNPVPSISSLSPGSIAAGSVPTTLVINGTNFIPFTSTVYFNGVARNPTNQTATAFSIPLQASDVATMGAYPVTISNPAPGGGASAPVNFNVVSGTPTGSFNVTVTATSGSLTHSMTFTLTVQ